MPLNTAIQNLKNNDDYRKVRNFTDWTSLPLLWWTPCNISLKVTGAKRYVCLVYPVVAYVLRQVLLLPRWSRRLHCSHPWQWHQRRLRSMLWL